MNGMKLEHLQELEEAMNLHLDIVFYLDGTMYNISWTVYLHLSGR